MADPIPAVEIEVEVNGTAYRRKVEPRMLLVDFIREELRLTGTHVGCESSYCGACTVLLDGVNVKSCTMFAFQADGGRVTTVEGLARDGKLSPVQEAFSECHGLQCGYCTPGLLISVTCLLRDRPSPTDSEIRKALAGNVCRCTGYQNIFKAVKRAAEIKQNA